MSKGQTLHLKTVGVFLLILTSAFALSRTGYSWATWKPATCMPERCFCEAIRPGTIAQPANTWSSFGFVGVGLMILRGRRRELEPSSTSLNPMIQQSIYANLYGLALILVGLGSAFYHASLTLVGQFFDVMGMYLLASFILLYNLSKVSRLVRKNFTSVYSALNLLLAATLLGQPHWRRYLFAILILAALLPEYFSRQKVRVHFSAKFLLAALATLLIAFVIWALDLNRVFCQPESWWQGHAFWHVLGAVAAGLLYKHYRMEQFSILARDSFRAQT